MCKDITILVQVFEKNVSSVSDYYVKSVECIDLPDKLLLNWL